MLRWMWPGTGWLILLFGLLFFALIIVGWGSWLRVEVAYFVFCGSTFCLAGLTIILGLDHRAHERLIRPPDCGARVRRLFARVGAHERFQQIAGLVGNSADANGFLQRFRRSLADAEVCYSPLYQGGYAGRRPPNRSIILALSPLALRVAAAAHELFHLVRDLRGSMPLDADVNLPAVLVEETIVWRLTIRYAPIRGQLELVGHLIAFGGLAFILYRVVLGGLTFVSSAW